MEWEASVLDWKSGLDVLDGERKLGWTAMEMGVLIPVGRVFGWLHSAGCLSPVSGEILGVVVRAVILCYCMGESVMAMPILS